MGDLNGKKESFSMSVADAESKLMMTRHVSIER